MTKELGYLLPAGEAYTDELCCALVFYPDKDEYRRALLGSIGYMATWHAWELDDDKRGKDAARAWKDAYTRTLECWNMACLDELIEDVAAMRALLANRKDCCDDNITFDLPPSEETEIDPRVGDPPDYYGETPVTDWDDWSEHLCYNAHLYVDNLINMADQLDVAVGNSSLYLALIAAGLVILSFTGIGLPIAFGLASGVVSGLIAAATLTTFSGSQDDFEDNRELIICALMLGESLADAVEAALGSGPAWDLFYQFVDYDSATAIIYEGGAAGEFLPTETRSDCLCMEGYEMILYAGWGTMDDQTHFSSEFAAGCWQSSQFRVRVTGTETTWRPWKLISIDTISGTCGGNNVYRIWDYPGESLIYDSNVPPTNISNCKFLAVKHATDVGSKEIIWTIE